MPIPILPVPTTYDLHYINNFTIIPRDSCHIFFLSDDANRNSNPFIHFLVEIGVIAQIRSLEKLLDLDGKRGT